jgi:hypothetical protein
MSSVIVLPDNTISSQVRLLQTGTGVHEGVGESVLVAVGVTVDEGVGLGVRLGVLVTSGVGEGVSVGVSVGVKVGEAIGEGVQVGVEGVQVEGGTVTWMETLTKIVRALSAVMGSGVGSFLERDKNGRSLGTTGR